MTHPTVTTWYENGHAQPWCLEVTEGPGLSPGTFRSDTYHGLMMHMADVWCRLQPEPMDDEYPREAAT